MSYLLYEGPSLIDGQPIFVALTGIKTPSRNEKTGPMAQVWAMRSDMHPLDALATGSDESICGDCDLRGHAGKERECYVNVAFAPSQIYKRKATLLPPPKNVYRHRAVRIGAYGDPASWPTSITADIHKKAVVTTGYSHQWKTCDQDLRNYVMASCESIEDRELAKSMGWSTFRIKTMQDPFQAMELMCPASEEAGKVLNCFTCGRCTGNQKYDVAINIHGRGKRFFMEKHA